MAALPISSCSQGAAWLCAPASPTAPVLPDGFTDELAAVGATFEMPAGFHVVATGENPHLSTELSILCDDGRMEVRYALRAGSEVLAMLDQCKNQPNCVGSDAFKAEVALGLTGAVYLCVVMLMHDPTAMSDLQPVVFHALRFREPMGLVGKWL